ncbi:hypothetical protein Pint_11531 [Pistacia integerrima]|uniref:Uncharacterized protein n=1 Tax=Pistacia integerrima TaxID=434235 RepID=A0ACC0XMV5_9ROSI|nr:hypothetical protein Pint_11531 [Pistacia integerrima]
MVRFFGNNSLSRPLPLQKGVKLQTIGSSLEELLVPNSE